MKKLPVTVIGAPWFGLYLPEKGVGPLGARVRRYEALLGARMPIISLYEGWGAGRGAPDVNGIEEILREGLVPMITWEPWSPRKWNDGGHPEEQPEFSLSRITGGAFDDYIRTWAGKLKNLSSPIFFRPMHEMNGNWYPWCGTVNGNRPEEYVAAWHHIRSLFREEGSDRLIWVWSPYAHSVPEEPENEMGRYFPGVEEVDWVGLDGYNWGTTREWSCWQSFGEIFGRAYDGLTRLVPDRPVMIAETACAEEGGDKAAWIRDALTDLKERFPRIEALVWFNVDKECDWRIESSDRSVASLRESWKDVSRSLSRDLKGGWDEV